MSYRITFASAKDEDLLRRIFQATEMDLVGDTEDHLAIRKNGIVCGGALLYQMDTSLYHLLTIAVHRDGRSRGIGSRLLKHILNRPWSCCRGAVADAEPRYRITTVSRGSSRNFYLKNGMLECNADSLYPPFDHQCSVCPEVADCHSTTLEYWGIKPGIRVPLRPEPSHAM